MTLFDKVKETANAQGYSLLSLNEKAGLGKNAIYKWKTQKPSIENLTKVAQVLHVSVDYLLGKNNSEAEDTKKKTTVDIDDDNVIMTFEGRPIPPEDLEVMKRFLLGGKRNHE
ncbi:helix-turn-helix domain-containing protein [Companilactobacillus zhongbaensis]|uniref:helix-turn-helix domain-containing protein n=1 Tax=Companilactobacillus zhongbaensis TaxID=2486009 RepID=UPI000F79720A|nr:helix-turn-helix transcriptional regulator [Companilactobacillus zhongbaensis]